jgi:hypothetical protein
MRGHKEQSFLVCWSGTGTSNLIFGMIKKTNPFSKKETKQLGLTPLNQLPNCQSSISKKLKGKRCLHGCWQTHLFKVRSRPHPAPHSNLSCKDKIGFLVGSPKNQITRNIKPVAKI